jgi:hypothetical protein
MQVISKIGQMQLIRRQISQLLNFQCKLESNNLYCALEVSNRSLLTDIQAHYANPDTKPYPDDENPLLPELTKYLETSGLNDPFVKVGESEPQFSLDFHLMSFSLCLNLDLYHNHSFGTLCVFDVLVHHLSDEQVCLQSTLEHLGISK